jgi:hypothetical protein
LRKVRAKPLQDFFGIRLSCSPMSQNWFKWFNRITFISMEVHFFQIRLYKHLCELPRVSVQLSKFFRVHTIKRHIVQARLDNALPTNLSSMRWRPNFNTSGSGYCRHSSFVSTTYVLICLRKLKEFVRLYWRVLPSLILSLILIRTFVNFLFQLLLWFLFT